MKQTEGEAQDIRYVSVVGPTIRWSESQMAEFDIVELRQIAQAMFDAGFEMEGRIRSRKART